MAPVEDKLDPPSRSVEQRVGATAASASGSSSSTLATPLMKVMLRGWANGGMPSNRFLEYTNAADTQGAAGLASLTNHANNRMAARDLRRAVGWPQEAPMFDWLSIPVDDQDEPLEFPIMLPHRFPLRMRSETWRKHFVGSGQELKELWGVMMKQPMFPQNHSLAGCNLKQTVPLGLHGDGGPFSKQDSLFAITWDSGVGAGQVRETRFPIAAILKPQLLDYGSTLQAVCAAIATAWPPRGMITGTGGGTSLQARGDWQV